MLSMIDGSGWVAAVLQQHLYNLKGAITRDRDIVGRCQCWIGVDLQQQFQTLCVALLRDNEHRGGSIIGVVV